MTEHDTKAAPLFTPLDELDMLEMHFQGLLEGYANKMEWFAIASRTDNVLASFKSLRRALGSAAQEDELVEAFIAQKKKCCRYCADDRPAFERDGAWWHEVARGGDACDTEPCKAHWYHAALAKYRAAPKTLTTWRI